MLPRDVIVLPEAQGRWVVMNLFSQTSLGVEAAALRVLEQASRGELVPAGEERFLVWEVERFANLDGLLADPTRYTRDVAAWPAPESLDAPALLARFKKHYLLVDDEAAYLARFAPKQSLLDGQHFGNFHQQLGEQLLLVQRQDPGAWWVRQKFREDLRGVRNNLYAAVQEHALRAYFKKKFKPGDSVVDVGCGIGFYCNLMAEAGASVLGVDPNAKYIGIARDHAAPGARFDVLPVGAEGALDAIPAASADYVFMSDALLFYFVSPGPKQTASIEVLFKDLRRILKPGGTFISVEPHSLFWLAPWLGDPRRPFTVLTEHLHRWFSVTPPISSFIQACNRGGFAITWMEELAPDPGYESVDTRGYHFARQFPVWQLCEMKVV